MSANLSLQLLLDELGRLPGIGPKSAQRIAYYLLEADAEEARRLAEAILEVKQEVHFCSRCFNYATADECSICQDSMRDTTRICVVGEPRDVQAIERTGSYHGLYHVLGGVISALHCVCSKGAKILIHSPTYIGFTMSLKHNGYAAVHSPLVKDENGVWRMDFEDMEKHLKEEKIHAAIMCNPHNPCGRGWERWELEKAMELYKKYNVYVVSDEIWSDIILSGHRHIPTQSISEDARMRTAALYAPSKTFNLAGLIGSYHIVYDPWWRDRIAKESSLCHYNSMNVLSMHALIGAYRPEGYEWADELCETLTGNVDFACDYIAKHFEGVHVTKPEGTYMLFVDCTDWCAAHGKSIQDVEKACWAVGAAVQDGVMFHGPCHLRINLASPRARIEEAFRRMDQYVFNAE